ncbi:hypothetical protein [Caenimonas aquaedulcis]|uniref:Uncharacterized protein n=1 Tax=Caenimonas aquaedulcis TaxID=2793270 RepID=A0A931MEP0_9BURK|nr:hypothetical protein [Caenimonas aquaedulcis]MBG9386778.1 hypothetical protein [Caenimonas aquaedulcis]
MADQEVLMLDEAHRLLLSEAGLEEAMALFPADVMAAVRTAINVRESFAALIRADSGLSPAIAETDGM